MKMQLLDKMIAGRQGRLLFLFDIWDIVFYWDINTASTVTLINKIKEPGDISGLRSVTQEKV